MSSFHRKEAPISEPFPCPECGKNSVVTVIENCRLDDGTTIKKLRHYKCRNCGVRLFDTDAMHGIQRQRAELPTAAR
jgi:transcription elongation factor Elf1